MTYHGFLTKEHTEQARKLRGLLAAADLFVLPSRDEPFGLVHREAAAHSLPVIASAVGGIPEQVLDGETGVLMAPGAFLTSGPTRLRR